MNGLPLIQDTGSNYSFGSKLMQPNTQISQFDLSYLNTLSVDPGQLVPVYFSYYYPGDQINLNIQNLVRLINTPLVPIMSRFRIFFHMFRVDYSQMWTYWESMMKRGWSGNFEAVLPVVKAPLAVDGKINPLLARGSLADFLGFNFSDYTYKSGDEDITVELPAMPFLAYQLIYRWYYTNHNVMSAYAVAQNDREMLAFFPDTDYDLMIQDLAPTYLTLDGSVVSSSAKNLAAWKLGELRYRDFAEDYFTSALPWPMRGDIPSMSLSENLDSVTSNVFVYDGVDRIPLFASGWANKLGESKVFSTLRRDNSTTESLIGVSLQSTPGTLQYGAIGGVYRTDTGESLGLTSIPDAQNSFNISSALSYPLQAHFVSAVTQSQLKLLWTNTLISEKLARTDGTYGQFIQTFFGQTPSHWSSHKPIYLGGTFQPLVVSQVLQTAPGDTGMVGSLGATGISSSDGHVGSFKADDFGVTMCLMSIMPDTYYSQGWLREHLYRTQDDFPLPERAQLGMQAITNAEIFYNPRDLSSNDVLFGYQSRMDELRYRQNEIHGKVADPSALSFFPYTQSRFFSAAPTLVPSFLSTKGNIRRDWLSAPDETTFIAQIANRVNAVRQLPYQAPPSAVMM